MTKKETQDKTRLVLSHMAINGFVEVTIPQGTKSLAINENYITDFVGLNSLPKLENLCLDKNPIISFRGFPKLPSLTNLSLIDTPISKLTNFRALAIVVAGQQLKTLNGIEVSTNDRAAALAYGPPETTCQLIIRGWLPKKPVSLPARKSRNNTDNNNNTATIKNRILQMVDEQENDPISVRITRVLRAQGYGISQIREFLIDFFSPHTIKKKEPKQVKEDSSIEAQIKKQQQIIDVLAAQLHALRSGNRTFNDYDEMIKTSGINLLKNAEILNQMETEDQNNSQTVNQNMNQNTNLNSNQNMNQNTNPNSNQNPEFSASKTKKKNKPEYEILRSAVIDFLQVSEDTQDDVLIQLLDSVGLQDELEEEEEDNQNYEAQQNQFEQQENQEIPQNQQQQYSQEFIDENSNAGTENNNNINELTEEEISQLDDYSISRPATRNIIADMDDKNENNYRVEGEEEEFSFNEEEEDKSQKDNSDNLNDTIDRGINVPETWNTAEAAAAPIKDADEEVKKMLDKMEKYIDGDESSQADNDFQPIDNAQSS